MTNDSTPEERQLIDSLCEKTRRMAVQTAARFVNVTKIPRIIAEKISLPDQGPIEFHAKEIDNSPRGSLILQYHRQLEVPSSQLKISFDF